MVREPRIMKKDIIYLLVPILFLVCVSISAHRLYQSSLSMAESRGSIEKINRWISKIEGGERPFSQAIVVGFLAKLRALEQDTSELWRNHAEAMKTLRLATVAFIVVLVSFSIDNRYFFHA
jgi:hypothetical protein